MNSDETKTPEAVIGKLVVSLRDVVGWQWDGRFKTALAEFPIDRKAEVLGVLEKHLVRKWDASDVVEAPGAVREIVTSLGGLMSGQLLFLSDLEDDPLVYCAWWPWSSGQTISIRIGLFSETMGEEEKGTLAEALKSWFGV